MKQQLLGKNVLMYLRHLPVPPESDIGQSARQRNEFYRHRAGTRRSCRDFAADTKQQSLGASSLTSVRPASPTISQFYLQRGSHLYLQRGSDPHLKGSTTKSRGRAMADVSYADILE